MTPVIDPASITVVPMTDVHALELSTWRYEGDMAVNDRDDDDVTYVIDPANGYWALTRSDELIGYSNFGHDARVPGGSYDDDGFVDVGLGLAPHYVGMRLGHDALIAVLDFAAAEFPRRSQRATIALDNRASRTVFERAGFVETVRFTAPSGVHYLQ